MKKIIVLLLCALPLMAGAQNVWERPQDGKAQSTEKEARQKAKEEARKAREAEKRAQNAETAKYMRGNVPVVDGAVCWTRDVEAPGKSAQQLYDIMYSTLVDLTRSEGQLEGSCVALVNKQEHVVVANVREWLVFSNSFLALDRAKFHYTLIARCSDGRVSLTMERLSYRYEENNKMQTYKAEEWITDDAAVNKKNTRLFRGPGKFRRATIDRKDFLFKTITEVVNKP